MRKIGDKVRIWNAFENRYNTGTVTNRSNLGGQECYQVLQDNERKSQWYHNGNEVLDLQD